MRKRVLITGSGSYVGGWVRRRLESEPDRFEVEELSVRGDAWRGFDFSRFDSVFHVAGIAHVSADPKMEPEYMRVNRDLAVEVGRRAKEAGAGQFVFMSSAIVYGDGSRGAGEPITARTEPRPANFYGRSKLEAEEGLRALESPAFRVAVLRCPMVYGPGCERGNFPSLVRLARKAPVFPDVENRRSMIYVKNLAELVAQLISRGGSGIFLPQNAEYSRTSELVRLIAREFGREVVLTKAFDPLLGTILSGVPQVRKAFGSLYYSQEASEFGFGYRLYDLEGSIRDIAAEDGWAR